ncbi:MAG TPA: peptidoglycan-associated lipoprotein Pal [Steroidobacteraceae bacterium]|jgi:peptidoglycan-associated lipoprotein|nr:peptidoglycan-associated lipoprotein Pal [Steroidobacteraceae bacterium]
MKKIVSVACLLAGVALLTGCPKKNTTAEHPTAGSQVAGEGSTNPNEGASTSGSSLGGEGAAGGQGAAAGPNAPAESRIIYFDFDKSDIKPEFAGIITANAQYLTTHQAAKLKLEGNTDERGTREYNIGLGERRAQAVRRALMLQGVAENQLTTVSFGAERPAVQGDDEAAWAKNRRVELVYTTP